MLLRDLLPMEIGVVRQGPDHLGISEMTGEWSLGRQHLTSQTPPTSLLPIASPLCLTVSGTVRQMRGFLAACNLKPRRRLHLTHCILPHLPHDDLDTHECSTRPAAATPLHTLAPHYSALSSIPASDDSIMRRCMMTVTFALHCNAVLRITSTSVLRLSDSARPCGYT